MSSGTSSTARTAPVVSTPALSKFTPGPLHIVEAKTIDTSGQWHVFLAAPDGRKIAALWGGQDEKIANARLFIAALDMLAALQAQEAAENCNDRDEVWALEQRAHKLRFAAIAKAVGDRTDAAQSQVGA